MPIDVHRIIGLDKMIEPTEVIADDDKTEVTGEKQLQKDKEMGEIMIRWSFSSKSTNPWKVGNVHLSLRETDCTMLSAQTLRNYVTAAHRVLKLWLHREIPIILRTKLNMKVLLKCIT